MDVSIYEPIIAQLLAFKKQIPDKYLSINIWDNLVHIQGKDWDGWIEKWNDEEVRYIKRLNLDSLEKKEA